MSSDFERQFAAFESRTIKRKVKRFWTLFDDLPLTRVEAEDWCITAQYGLNLRNIFEAIDDDDWSDVEKAIEELKLYV